MKSTSRWVGLLGLGLAVGMVWMVARAGAGEPPAPPKVSSFAPAKDVASEVQKYIKRLEDAVANEADYKDAETNVPKDANTLILLALAAGLHDEDNAYKAAAPAMIKAAQAVAAAEDYAGAKAAVEGLKKAAESKGDASSLKWAKIASLEQLMKAVPLVNNRLKRNVRAASFKRKTADNAGDSATLAVIAQGSMADTSEAKTPAQEKQWFDFCSQMREAAASVNKIVHEGKADATDKAMEVLTKSCDDCHAVFHTDQVGKN